MQRKQGTSYQYHCICAAKPSNKKIIMSAVIFDPAAAPSLEEYLQAIAGKPSDEQESLQILAPWL